MHIRFNAVVTGFFLFVEMAAIVTACVLGFFFAKSGLNWSGLRQSARVYIKRRSNSGEPRDNRSRYRGRPILIQRLSLGALSLRGEAHLGGKHNKLVNAIFISFLITVVFELLPLTAAILGAPDLAALQNSPFAMAYLVKSLGGHTLNVIVSLGIALAIFNAVLACIITLARVIYSSGRDKAWPGAINDWLAAVSPRFKTHGLPRRSSG